MRRIAAPLICVFMLVACSHETEGPSVELRHGWPPAQIMAALDRAAGFKSSPRDEEPELRVWKSSMMEMKGYIISPGSALNCNALYRNNGLTVSVESAHCVASFMSAEMRHGILSLAGELSTLNGKSWGCALGGYTLLVEGFANHQRFTFLVSNPSDCKDTDSQLVSRLVASLRSQG